MFKISDMTEAHAQQEGVINNGSETVVNLVGGGTIRGGDEYVRVCDDDGRELMYWHQQEFVEDFQTAMGNFLQLAARCVEAGTAPVDVKHWLLAGELDEDCKEWDSFIEEIGVVLDKNGAGEILGPVLFIGTDDQLYTATVEASIDRANEEFARDNIASIAPEDIGPEAREILARHGIKIE